MSSPGSNPRLGNSAALGSDNLISFPDGVLHILQELDLERESRTNLTLRFD